MTPPQARRVANSQGSWKRIGLVSGQTEIELDRNKPLIKLSPGSASVTIDTLSRVVKDGAQVVFKVAEGDSGSVAFAETGNIRAGGSTLTANPGDTVKLRYDSESSATDWTVESFFDSDVN